MQKPRSARRPKKLDADRLESTSAPCLRSSLVWTGLRKRARSPRWWAWSSKAMYPTPPGRHLRNLGGGQQARGGRGCGLPGSTTLLMPLGELAGIQMGSRIRPRKSRLRSRRGVDAGRIRRPRESLDGRPALQTEHEMPLYADVILCSADPLMSPPGWAFVPSIVC